MKTKRIILSRKGFDGTAGGKPSLILNNRMYSFPIPRADSGVFYQDLVFDSNRSYRDVFRDLGINMYSECHLDPDLRFESFGPRNPNWKGLFGQGGAAQTLLSNQNVQEGDLFLFFGWFREGEIHKGKIRYKPSAPDLHALYGYLEVSHVYDLRKGDAPPSWATYHPHVNDRETYGRSSNTLYESTHSLSFSKNQRGWGTFRYAPEIVLTKEGAATRSTWELPPCFKGEAEKFFGGKTITYLLNGDIGVQIKGITSQELMVSQAPSIIKWAEELVKTFAESPSNSPNEAVRR